VKLIPSTATLVPNRLASRSIRTSGKTSPVPLHGPEA
jgi:hypothetical protein